ncbi:hypothetical protein [Williamsia maris]|nr:hypothetical protein [Williamsia maris]
MTPGQRGDGSRDVEPIEGRPWISRMSTPSSRVKRIIAVIGALAIIGVAVPLFISLFTGGGSDDDAAQAPSSLPPVTSVARSAEPMYSSPGECVSLTATDRGITPQKSSCTAAGFTFIVASALQQASDDCGVGQYSQLTQPGFGKLCIVPNFSAGECYSVPSATGTLVDFRAAPCNAAAADRTQVIRVQGRAPAATIDCPGGQVVSFAKPSALSYCIAPAT